MSFTFWDLASACGLFAGMLACGEVGRRIGLARLARDPDGLAKGSGPVEAAVFGLLGLLLAFTFSGAASRFEERRHLIAVEANAIGTAYLRVDLLPADAQPEIRQLMRRYLDTRVETYRNAADAPATQARLLEATGLQRGIWERAVSASGRPGNPPQAAMLLLPALNEMIDIATTRAVALQNHPPRVIFLLLGGLSLISSMLAGYVMCSTRVRSWFYQFLIASTLSITLYVILDVEYPRFGLIRIDAADQTLTELRKQMQ
jgi:hypothetical protein